MTLLSVQNIRVSFIMRKSTLYAVRGVSFDLEKGETLGIVGESGCGKSVLVNSLLRLILQPPGRIEGKALFNGIDMMSCSDERLRSIRGNLISMIFQDPLSAFNPYLRLSEQLIEPLLIHNRSVGRSRALERATELLEKTGVPSPSKRIQWYPHEFSGGMLQRAMIVMALITEPEILIADEPTTALDVTVQAQILNLLKGFQRQYGTSVVFITHNLGIVGGFCDRIMIMYAGMVVESGPVEKVFFSTAHPYTRALMRSVPGQSGSSSLCSIPGAPPDSSQKITGCPFLTRCEYRTNECASAPVVLKETGNGHLTACIRAYKGEIVW